VDQEQFYAACKADQDQIRPLIPYLKGLPALQDRVMDTSRRIKNLDDSHDKSMAKMDTVLSELTKVTLQIREVIVRFDNAKEQSIEAKRQGEKIDAKVEELKNEIGVDRGRIITLEAKQGGILAVASKVSPWLITFGYVVYNQITK